MRLLLGLTILLVGCAVIPGPDAVLDLRGEVKAKLLEDIDAAHAAAVAYGDALGALCYPVLREYVAQDRPPIEVKGLISAYERARILRLSIQQGFPLELQVACAPVLRDTEKFLRDLLKRAVL